MGIWNSSLSKLKIQFNARKNRRHYKVAILTPGQHGVSQHIKKGFIETLQSKADRPVIFKTFDSFERKSKITKDLGLVAAEDYDALFTIGCSCTKTAVSFMEDIHSDIPIVCAGILSDLFPKDKIPKNLSGFTAEPTNKKVEQLHKLFAISSNIKHILFLYDFQTRLAQVEKERVESVTNEHQVFFSHMDSSTFDEVKFVQFTRLVFPKIDAIILNRDNATLMLAPQIINYCKAAGIPLVTFDFYTVKQGATLGFGTNEEKGAGKATAERMLEILHRPEDDRRTQEKLIPLVQQYKVIFNTESMKNNNFCIDTNLVAALQHIDVV